MTFNKVYPNQELRALSWKQPYATMMLHGKVETRTWPTDYRGWVLICASKKPYTLEEVVKISGAGYTNNMLPKLIGKKFHEQFNGHAIAVGYLQHCERMLSIFNDTYVKYKPGLFLHHYASVQAIHPIPWTGTQGWKTVSDEFKDQIILL